MIMPMPSRSCFSSNTRISVTDKNRSHDHLTFLTGNNLKNKILTSMDTCTSITNQPSCPSQKHNAWLPMAYQKWYRLPVIWQSRPGIIKPTQLSLSPPSPLLSRMSPFPWFQFVYCVYLHDSCMNGKHPKDMFLWPHADLFPVSISVKWEGEGATRWIYWLTDWQKFQHLIDVRNYWIKSSNFIHKFAECSYCKKSLLTSAF